MTRRPTNRARDYSAGRVFESSGCFEVAIFPLLLQLSGSTCGV